MTNDDFGDRMKAYEAVETSRRLDASLPIYARIDGRSFSRFTRGLERPYDARMSLCMIDATRALVDATHARIGYTQSDEISLVYASDGDMLFDAKVQKLTSVLAGLTTAAFLNAVHQRLPEYAVRLPHFDCRAFNLPSRTEAANALLWRERDAVKNSVSMAARAHFSHKALDGKSVRDMRQMLADAGVDFEAYPTFFKRGTWLRRVTFDRAFSSDELARIPEAHRPSPDTLVTRSEVREVTIPDFNTVANREAVVFDGARPVPLVKAA